ncbi:MAG: hypothetical protein CXR31_14720 [Geobacter sp.]|nr:MAG: hypothetical protein CXR31_14720 [Geobacter sp.]
MDDVGTDPHIYLFRRDAETYCLYRVNRNSLPIKIITVSWTHLLCEALDLQSAENGWGVLFHQASLLMEQGEKQHREVIKRISRRNSRNIVMQLDTIWSYARTTFDTENPYRKITQMQKERLMELLKSGLDAVRAELKIDAGNPVEYSYEITYKVINAAPNERCQQLLERLQTQHPGPIYPDLLEKIKAQIEQMAPDESDRVLRVLGGTRNREHLAAISVTSEDDELCVTLVNIHGQKIRMEAWNFVNLLENQGTALRLADLTTGFREQCQVLVFNLNKKGKVFGRFIPARSTIEVVCLQDSDNSVSDRATFVIDIDYALCVYAAVKRLRDDKERFNRLKEKAENTIEHDPFDKIFQSMEAL